MTEKDLIQSAKEVYTYNQEAAKEYAEKSELMVHEMNVRMLDRTDWEKLIGSENQQMMKDNHANHARFIASILQHYKAEVFVETVLWVFKSYRKHGFSDQYWSALLNTWMKVLKEVLSKESYPVILSVYEWMQINIPEFILVSEAKDGIS